SLGTCLADYSGDDSDRTSVVDCTQPHSFAVLGEIMWPDMQKEIAAADAQSVFDAIQNDSLGPLGRVYWAWVYEECRVLMRTAIGLEGVTISGVSAADLELIPGGNWSLDMSLASADAFASGELSTLCAVRWTDLVGENAMPAMPAGVTVVDMLTKAAPEVRACFTRDPDADPSYVNVECSKSHNGQYLIFLNALPALGADFVATADPETTIFAEYAPLDDFCTEALDTLFPGVLSSDDWGVWSDQQSGVGSWEGYDGTVLNDGYYPVYCGILAHDGRTFTGDVISGDVNVSISIG
ncbi:MAG: hypothetical protein ABL886_07955, partial [Rhodoglobus sp.]